jgi:hypothetical protein
MCDPLTAVTIGGAVLSGAGALYEGSQAAAGLAATQNAQNEANANWVAYQKRIHDEQAQQEDAARNKATAAQRDTLDKISPQAQTQTQQTEQQRLNSLYQTPGGGQASNIGTPSNLLLSGEQTGTQGATQNFMGDLTKQVSQATAAARQRISALATASSYGGSFGGLGTTVPIALAKGGNAINLQNAIRQGDLKTYGVEQQVQPIQYAVGPGTENQMSMSKALGSMAGTLASAGITHGIGSGSFGSLFSGAGGGATGVSAGLSPSFTSSALTSFNDPAWNTLTTSPYTAV